jgi:hypothetical protein
MFFNLVCLNLHPSKLLSIPKTNSSLRWKQFQTESGFATFIFPEANMMEGSLYLQQHLLSVWEVWSNYESYVQKSTNRSKIQFKPKPYLINCIWLMKYHYTDSITIALHNKNSKSKYKWFTLHDIENTVLRSDFRGKKLKFSENKNVQIEQSNGALIGWSTL